MTKGTAPGGRSAQGPGGTEADRAAEREAEEQGATSDAAALEGDVLPPGHPAQADAAFSAGEMLSQDDAVPGEAGRPGRAGDAGPAA